MSKPKHRNRFQQRRQKKAHFLYMPEVGEVQLSPSRASTTPFCAYYGSQGQVCSATASLQLVGTLPGFPVYQYMACPLHFDLVAQMLRDFLASLEDHARHVNNQR